MNKPLLSLDEALLLLAQGAAAHRITGTERLSTFEALGRVLAEDVQSALDVPPADNTSMDGYALRAADVPAAGTELRVAQRIPAGQVGQPLEPGTAARIFTGGQLPAGADAVVILTEWRDYASLDWEAIAAVMRRPAWLFDARAIADAAAARAAGLNVWRVGEG